MSFIAKLEKVRLVTLGRREGQPRDGGFCYSLALGGGDCPQGCGARASGPAPGLWLTPPGARGDVFDIHRCRSTLQDTGRPSPITFRFHQPFEKAHKV